VIKPAAVPNLCPRDSTSSKSAETALPFGSKPLKLSNLLRRVSMHFENMSDAIT
jgi:hypothetical protein